MNKRVALVTIHGMGCQSKMYAKATFDLVKRALPPGSESHVLFRSIHYQDVLQKQQDEVYERMRMHLGWKSPRKFLLYFFSDAASLEYKKETRQSAYYLTQEAIMKTMEGVFDSAGQTEIPVILLAHSLGCHVISSYIWDSQQKEPGKGVWSAPLSDGVPADSLRDRFRRMKSVRYLYTIGCNIPIFVAGHRQIEAIRKPHPDFRWINLYDRDDVFGWPLRPLSASYQQIVEDKPINAGGGFLRTILTSWNPLCHNQYWTEKSVIRDIVTAIQALLRN